MMYDAQTRWLFGGVLGLLLVASVTGRILKSAMHGEPAQKVIANLNARINAWWIMCGVFIFALVAGRIATVVMFGLISFLALREFITITPTKRRDHRALFWAFFIILPYQYYLVGADWYGLLAICIPVYAYLLIPIRNALAGDTERFLERTSKIQWGLMVCVYFVSYAPALLNLRIPSYEKQNAKLLFFLVFVVQISDVLQYVWGKCLGRRPIAPNVSPNKTIEGFIGGALSATALGAALWWITPFRPWQAALMAAAIVVMGFFGGLVMSAIKRDRGVKDYGDLIPGHGGIMDRIDSLCFAAPVFFHLTRYFFT
ncbi:MAG TPA: phosphatidate cytidylyltransferase [Chthoniobacteraceae bacterium]|nr:phosphatidate cytidylyltransferase [Chthoniobacteraceae bacterium]